MVIVFKELLALLLTVIIFPALWILHALGLMNLPGEVIGATLTAEALILQYFFRKASQLK